MTTDNRLDEIRHRLKVMDRGDNRWAIEYSKDVRYLLQLLDARPAEPMLTEEESQLVIGAIPLQALPGRPNNPIGPSDIDQAADRACQESTLIRALSWIAVWESERVVKQARANPQWETCFRRCFEAVFKRWADVPAVAGDARALVADWCNDHPALGQSLEIDRWDIDLIERITAHASQRYREAVADSVQQARHSGCSVCGDTIADAITAALLQESE